MRDEKSITALFYVQHLFGIGHMARAQRIAQGLINAGVRTALVQGGAETGLPPVPGVEMYSLTPVRVDSEDMTTLLHDDGRPFTNEDQAARRDSLLALVQRIKPDILIIEAFPFGRRQLRFELIPLLEMARNTSARLIATSIRDILRDKRKPGRAEETIDLIERYFDLVLVHGDEAVVPLAKTFPLAAAFAHKTIYTGLVGPVPPRGTSERFDIVVSAGGGVYGTGLIETATHVAMHSGHPERSWLILAGQNMPDADFARLKVLTDKAGSKINFKRTVPDLCSVLGGAKVSVSYAGYNTVADIMVAGCAAVLVPYVTPKENEQYDRTALLAEAGRVVHLAPENLTEATLERAILDATLLPKAHPAALDGATASARVLLSALHAKKNCPSSRAKPASYS